VKQCCIERTRRSIERWIARGVSRVWVVAVSGGGDSVGLLRVLCELAEPLSLSLSVAHLDHGVRGDAAREDARFVEELARSLGLEADLARWQPDRTGHFEADARRARYDWLTQVARARGAGAVAVGHTRDDQAETILHRILRGTGPRGLAGIPARRSLVKDSGLFLVRPLLRVSRREIRDYLDAVGQPFREDETNATLTGTRGRIRNDLLPKLAAEYNPAVREALLRLGELSGSLARTIDREALGAARRATVTAAEHTVVLKRKVLQPASRFMRAEILRRLWRQAGWPERSMSAARWRRLAALAGKKDEIERRVIGASVGVWSDGPYVVLRRSPRTEASLAIHARPGCEIPLAIPGRTDVSWAGCSVEVSTERSADDCRVETVDFDRVSGRLFIRAPLAGDRFDPLGMGGKTMALADFFRGRRVAREKRVHTPLLCDQDGIVWVGGHRIAERVKATERTEHVLTLRLTSCDGVSAGGRDSEAKRGMTFLQGDENCTSV
jgi:tRNA(Ile)-lysidine synthase